MFVSPLKQEIQALVQRLREQRQRLLVGLPMTEQVEGLLDKAASLLERCEDEVQALYAFELQVGEKMPRAELREATKEHRRLVARLEELRTNTPSGGG